jgi:hypothetical protein
MNPAERMKISDSFDLFQIYIQTIDIPTELLGVEL